MLISVIIPVYNVEKYLRECLDSILEQTYKKLDVIMVDDGSTDSSGKICDEYAEKYNNFRVIHKQNAGLGMARNTGLEYFKGEFVTFVDSDDYLDKDYVKTLYNAICKYKVDVCKSGFRRVSNERDVIALIKYQNEIFEGKRAKDTLLPRLIGSSPSKKDSIEMAVCGAMYNAKYIREFEIRFPSERLLISEDLIFNLDYMQRANGACTISYIGYNYRFNVGSLSTQYRKDRFEASRYFYLEVKNRLVKLGYGEDTLLRLQRMFFVYLRMCIGQEKSKVSGLSKKESVMNINKICSDKVVQEVICEYPTKELGIKQRVFLKLVKNRYVNILYFFAEKNFM